MTNIRREFGALLRKIRTQKGLSQEELALKAGLDRTYISQVERGRRNISIENIAKLAKALEVLPKDLFSF